APGEAVEESGESKGAIRGSAALAIENSPRLICPRATHTARITMEKMQLADIYLQMGEDQIQQLMRSVSIGRLKTYQLFDRVKARLHLTKLNSETLRKAAPRVWTRLQERDDEFASDLAQAILISHMDMIQAVLNHLGIPHEDGF